MSELKTNLEQILQEKTTKLIPENIKRKVEIFDVTGTDGDAEVEELQAKIIETRQEIADTRRDLENSAATVTGTGENVTLNQTAEATFKKLGVGGNSKQAQYTGKNLFKPIPSATRNGITFTNNGDGSYTLNGTATAPTSFYVVNVGYGSETYALSANNPVTNNDVILQLETSNGNKNTALNAINKTLIDNCDDINALSIIVSNGTTLSNFVIKPQLELGSSVTDFEPYVGGTASPNPDYPQEITNVTGDVEVVVENKNLFDWDKIVNLAWDIASGTLNETLSNGAIVTGDTSASSQASAYSKGWFRPGDNRENASCRINLRQTSDVVISADVTLLQLGYSNEMFIYLFGSAEFTDATKDSLILNQKIRVNRMYRNVPKGTYYPVFTLSSNKVKIENIQIELNTVATEYIEHKEQTFIFPLGNEKLMLGDYLADDGIHHVRGQYVFTGSESWYAYTGKNTQNYYCYYTNAPSDCIAAQDEANLVKCNVLPESTWDDIYRKRHDTQIIALRDNKRFYVRVPFATLVEWEAYITQHYTNETPVAVEYILEQEVVTPYTEEQQEVYNQIKQAYSYYEQTNVSSNAIALFEVTAFRDADLVITSLDNQLTLKE